MGQFSAKHESVFAPVFPFLPLSFQDYRELKGKGKREGCPTALRITPGDLLMSRYLTKLVIALKCPFVHVPISVVLL